MFVYYDSSVRQKLVKYALPKETHYKYESNSNEKSDITYNLTSGLGFPFTLTIKRRYVFSKSSVSLRRTKKYGAFASFRLFFSSSLTVIIDYRNVKIIKQT